MVINKYLTLLSPTLEISRHICSSPDLLLTEKKNTLGVPVEWPRAGREVLSSIDLLSRETFCTRSHFLLSDVYDHNTNGKVFLSVVTSVLR